MFVSPTVAEAQVLISAARGPGANRARTAYPGLNPWHTRSRTWRLAWSMPVTPFAYLSVLGREGVDHNEPLTHLSRVVGNSVIIRIAIRTSASGKAIPWLFHPDGSAAGVAKIAWNTITSTWVDNEASTLRTLDGRIGDLRTPRLRDNGVIGGWPYLIAHPLPDSIGTIDSPMIFAQLPSVFPVHRMSRVSSTAQFRSLVDRWRNL